MPKVTYKCPDGEEITVENASGNLMITAVNHQVPGIDGDCGGVCSCATCHVKVDADWLEKVGTASEIETGMLALEDEADETSRLGCQVQLSDELDGLIVKVVGR